MIGASLASLFELGQGGAVDNAAAAKWYRLAAAQNMPRAQYQLAVMLKEGRGVEIDYAEALLYLRSLASNNVSYAENELGNMYKNGLGVSQDYLAAVDWYWKAANQNNDVAFANLSFIYEKGLGVSKNLVVSYALMKCASSINSESEVYKDALNRVMEGLGRVEAMEGEKLSYEVCRRKRIAVSEYLE
ncbi:hypothetical protein ALP82_01466 [Pseudomonas savastanoi pv. fraxini]|nr:hypothetical protein ALP81_01707 [Pseudomonas savastanoi pv. fraxini]RMR74286.1 hypothetical protein ALP82_01466 [Pseudomonas savastanoi pv. fraxini]